MEQNSGSFLVFQIRDELFALEVQRVLKILEMQKLTNIPQAPDFIKGVVNHQGNVLPVVSTRLKFGLPEVGYTRDTCIIVAEIRQNEDIVELGLIVDKVLQVNRFENQQITEFPDLGRKFNSELIRGVFRRESDFVMVLDADRLFSGDDQLFLMKIEK